MAKQRSFPVKFALGVWHFVNGSRKVFLNLLFLLFIYLVFLAFQPPETFRLKPNSTLVIRPYGNVVEQYTTTPLDRALEEATGQERSETRLRDMLEAIHRAAGDSDITQLVIDPNYLRRYRSRSIERSGPCARGIPVNRQTGDRFGGYAWSEPVLPGLPGR